MRSFFVSVISTRLEKTRFLWGFVVFVWKKLQWRLRNERCYEELDTCNYHLIVAKNTILLKLMINLINNIRCVARMEMKCMHKKDRGLRGPPRGPQSIQDKVLVGAQGAKLPETPMFYFIVFSSISCKRNRVTSLFSSKHRKKFPRLIWYKKGVI